MMPDQRHGGLTTMRTSWGLRVTFKIALDHITVKLVLFRPPDSIVIRLHGHDVSYVGLKHNQVG